MAEGPGKYDEIVTRVREELDAKGIMLIVADGPEGSGCSVQGTFGAHFEFANLLDQISKATRAQMRQHVAENVEPTEPDDAGIPDADHDSEDYVQMDMQELAVIAHSALTFIRKKTQTWEEGLYSLAIAISCMVALRESEAADIDRDDPGYARRRVNEVIDNVLNKIKVVAVAQKGDEPVGIKVGGPEILPPQFRQ